MAAVAFLVALALNLLGALLLRGSWSANSAKTVQRKDVVANRVKPF